MAEKEGINALIRTPFFQMLKIFIHPRTNYIQPMQIHFLAAETILEMQQLSDLLNAILSRYIMRPTLAK
jgi:hypothetical protein